MFLKGYVDEESRLGEAKKQSGGVVPTADLVMKRLDQVRSRVRYHG